MPNRRIVDLREGPGPLLNIASYGSRGPGHCPLSKAEIADIDRTVRRAPEVVVKVSGGARRLRGVAQRLDYIGREGRGEVQTDDGEPLQGKGFEKALLEDWDLDLEAQPRRSERAIAVGRRPPKLVHNLVFSMPKGTPPDKVLRAVRVFGRERFALKHRYLMALHVDQGHPHVHMVVKAVSEQGVRLYIRKPMLREWRQDFAKYLRDLGVEANATERAVRGATRSTKRDGVHRAMLRHASTHMRKRVEIVVRELTARAGSSRSQARQCFSKRARLSLRAGKVFRIFSSSRGNVNSLRRSGASWTRCRSPGLKRRGSRTRFGPSLPAGGPRPED